MVFKPCQTAQSPSLPARGLGKPFFSCSGVCLSCHKLRESGRNNLLRKNMCTSRAETALLVGFLAGRGAGRLVGPLGVSRGPPLRTLAAGPPGPRSPGDPRRFRPPGCACVSTPAGRPPAHPSLKRGCGRPVRRCVAVSGRAHVGGCREGGCARGRLLGGKVATSGRGLGVPEAPQRSRGCCAAPGPVPLHPVTFACHSRGMERVQNGSIKTA